MSKNSSDVVITSALRTPIGRYKGSLKNLSASKLGSIAIKEVIYKSKLDFKQGLKKTIDWFQIKENLKKYKSDIYNI